MDRQQRLLKQIRDQLLNWPSPRRDRSGIISLTISILALASSIIIGILSATSENQQLEIKNLNRIVGGQNSALLRLTDINDKSQRQLAKMDEEFNTLGRILQATGGQFQLLSEEEKKAKKDKDQNSINLIKNSQLYLSNYETILHSIMTTSADNNPYKRDSEAIGEYDVNRNNRPFFVLDAISPDLTLSLFSPGVLMELNYWTLQEKSLIKALESPSSGDPLNRYHYLIFVYYSSRAQSAAISAEMKRLYGQIDTAKLAKEIKVIRDTTWRAIMIESKKAFPNSAVKIGGKTILLSDSMVQKHHL
jgi:hypothetical protein